MDTNNNSTGEIKQSNNKWSMDPREGRNRKKKQNSGSNRKHDKVVDFNLTITIIILTENGLNPPIKRQNVRRNKKERLNYILSTRNLL